MVNASGNVGYQAFAAQPAVASGPEPPVRPESVQPRQAPAADSQRADQKSLASREEPPPPPKKDAQPEADSQSRGSQVDVQT